MSTETKEAPQGQHKEQPKPADKPAPPKEPPKKPVKTPAQAPFAAQFERPPGGPPGSTKPTEQELVESAYGIQDDVSFYVFRDDAVRQGYGNFEASYEAYCKQQPLGTVPHRVRNVAPDNIWQYPDDTHPAGVPCVLNNPQPLPLGLEQWQIDAINACVPVQTVVFAKPPQPV